MCIAAYAPFIDGPQRGVAFDAIYLALALSLFALERWLPFEPAWLENDEQMPADLAHTLLSKGVVQALVLMGAVIGIGGDVAPGRYWPSHWPLVLQVVIGLVVIEFGLYWAYRLARHWPLLWRFHAVHHSVKRLWFFNTGRFHLLYSLALGVPMLWLVGAPGLLIIWVSAITAFIGILTDVNMDVRCGPLNYLFNTSQLRQKLGAVGPYLRHLLQSGTAAVTRYRHSRADAGAFLRSVRAAIPARAMAAHTRCVGVGSGVLAVEQFFPA